MTLYEKIKEYDIDQMANFLVAVKSSGFDTVGRISFILDKSYVEREISRMLEILNFEMDEEE